MKKISKRSGNYSTISKEAAPFPAPDFITGGGLRGPISGPPAVIEPMPTSLVPSGLVPAAGIGGTGVAAGELAVVYSAGTVIAAVLVAVGALSALYRAWYQNVDLFERMGISQKDSLDDAFKKWKSALLNSDMRTTDFFGVSFPKNHKNGSEFVESFNEPFNNGEKIDSGYFALGMQKAGVIEKGSTSTGEYAWHLNPFEKGNTDFHDFGKAADFYNYSNDIEKFVNTYNILAELHKEAFSIKSKMSERSVAKKTLEVIKLNNAYFSAIKSTIDAESDSFRKEKIKTEALSWIRGRGNDLSNYVVDAHDNYEVAIKKFLKFDSYDTASKQAYEMAIKEGGSDLEKEVEAIATGYMQPSSESASTKETSSSPSPGSDKPISARTDSTGGGMAYTPDPIYNYGYDPIVEQIQDLLIRFGFTTGEDKSGKSRELISDGKYGPITDSAVKKAVSKINPEEPTSGTPWERFIADKRVVLRYLQEGQGRLAEDAKGGLEATTPEVTPDEGRAEEVLPAPEVMPAAPSTPSTPPISTPRETPPTTSDADKVAGVKNILDLVMRDELKFEMFQMKDLISFGLSLNEERRIKLFVGAFDGNTGRAAERLVSDHTYIKDDVKNFADKTAEQIKSLPGAKSGILSIFKPINEIYKAACGDRYRRTSVAISRIRSTLGIQSSALFTALETTGSKKSLNDIVKIAVQQRRNKAKLRLNLR